MTTNDDRNQGRQDMDLLVPPDQGPSTEAAGAVHPDGDITREEDHLPERGTYPDADQDTGIDDAGQAAAPASGDTSVPGEVRGEGNALGLVQGVDEG